MSAPGRILIVDDDPDIQTLLSLVLRTLGGFDVVGIAGTVREADELLRDTKPELAIVDVGLPDGIGSTLLESPHAGDTLFVILSAQVSHQHEDLRALGAAAVLDKPCTPQRVVEAVSELLAR